MEVDPNQWAALKGQAQAEGRFVRVLLGEAIGAYLDRIGVGHVPLAAVVLQPLGRPTVEGLRELVRSVPAGPHQEPDRRKETLREKLEREAAARDWIRSHPEDEGQ